MASVFSLSFGILNGWTVDAITTVAAAAVVVVAFFVVFFNRRSLAAFFLTFYKKIQLFSVVFFYHSHSFIFCDLFVCIHTHMNVINENDWQKNQEPHITTPHNTAQKASAV